LNIKHQAAPLLEVLQAEADAWLAAHHPDPGDGDLQLPGLLWKRFKKLTFGEICREAVLPQSLQPSKLVTMDRIQNLYNELRENI